MFFYIFYILSKKVEIVNDNFGLRRGGVVVRTHLCVRIAIDRKMFRIRGICSRKSLLVNRTSLYPVYEQDIQDVQDVQDEEACGSQSVSLVMKPLILAILSVLAILLQKSRKRQRLFRFT